MDTSKEIDELRAYLLGLYEGQDEKEKIEERLMLDEEYFEQLLLQEEELVEDYVDDELDANKRECFESHFLIPAERREKVKLARLLKTYADEEEVLRTLVAKAPQKVWGGFGRFFLSPIPISSLLLVVLGVSVVYWDLYYRGSDDLQQALNSLNKAYASERLIESHVSKLDYAPFNKTRDQDEAKINWIDQNRAERISLDEVSENSTTESLHLLARVYLARKEFDKALQLLEEAQKTSPQNPEILSDLGAVYLEKSKIASKNEEQLSFVANAIENFDKALTISPNLLPARFNKAIATEIYLPNRAKEAWQEYLDLDPTSKWADEARNHLDALNNQNTRDFSTGEELESAFVEAYEDRNDERAFQIVSQNRELINEKYLPQRFAMMLVNKKKTKDTPNLSC